MNDQCKQLTCKQMCSNANPCANGLPANTHFCDSHAHCSNGYCNNAKTCKAYIALGANCFNQNNDN